MRHVGTPFDDADVSPWTPPWPAGDARPLVLVSLSTLDQGQAPVMQRVIHALAPLPVRGLVTLGPALDPAQFTPPPNVRLEAFLPHSAVLPHAAAMLGREQHRIDEIVQTERRELAPLRQAFAVGQNRQAPPLAAKHRQRVADAAREPQRRRVIAKKHLAAAALPAHVIGVVDVANEVGLLETDDVPQLKRSHD